MFPEKPATGRQRARPGQLTEGIRVIGFRGAAGDGDFSGMVLGVFSYLLTKEEGKVFQGERWKSARVMEKYRVPDLRAELFLHAKVTDG